MKIILATIAGGSGSRLWPLSRKSYPKQFHKLVSDVTMLESTVTRFKNIEIAEHVILCSEQHRFIIAQHVEKLGINAKIILEPKGKNTAPAAALAAIYAQENHEDALVLITPADHEYKDLGNLETQIDAASQQAADDKIVTFGIKPSQPETGYGYIKYDKSCGQTIMKIDEFVEKPDMETAEQYLASGDYAWNSGMFLFKASSMLHEMELYCPDIKNFCELSYKNKTTDFDFIRIEPNFFDKCPSDSIDFAVMEHTQNGMVALIESEWSDLGAWKSIWEFNDKDESSNVIKADATTVNTTNSLIIGDPNFLITAIGLDNVAIIQTKDALLLANMDNSEDVKQLVSRLKEEERPEYMFHREVFRPWGKYDSIDSSDRYQVKRITVKPGQKLSVQKHFHRSEHWIVVAGTALVHKGFGLDALKTRIVRENESIYIEIGEIHSLENPGRMDLELIEVQSGGYLCEDDIIRYKDLYGRTNVVAGSK